MTMRRTAMDRGKWTLVTGGAGFVGAVVVDELLARGRRVRVLDSLLHGSVSSLLLAWTHPRFGFHRADIRDQEARRAALEGVDAVVHLAAIVGDPACARMPDEARAVNLEATLDFLDESRSAGVKRFVFASTCSNYGKVPPESFADEDSDLNPVSLYAETKVAAEEAISGVDGSIATSCLRFATVFGTSPRMRFDLTVNEFTRDVAVKGELVVYGEQFWRPYVHVRDAARAIALVLEAPTEAVESSVFNIGDESQNYRKLDLTELLSERFPTADVTFVHKDEDPRDYRVGFTRVRERLGFSAEHTVADGVDEVVALLNSGLIRDPYEAIYKN
jgi:nucleoside-diphosphate-sugar epimerase